MRVLSASICSLAWASSDRAAFRSWRRAAMSSEVSCRSCSISARRRLISLSNATTVSHRLSTSMLRRSELVLRASASNLCLSAPSLRQAMNRPPTPATQPSTPVIRLTNTVGSTLYRLRVSASVPPDIAASAATTALAMIASHTNGCLLNQATPTPAAPATTNARLKNSNLFHLAVKLA